MCIEFVIKGTLPTLNEIIDASKKHWSQYHKMKRDFTDLVAFSCNKIPKMEKVDVTITWICKDKRMDKDNVIAGQKFIFDGLVKARKLSNDGWSEIGNINHVFEVDKENPRVIVSLQEVGEPIGSG